MGIAQDPGLAASIRASSRNNEDRGIPLQGFQEKNLEASFI